MYRIPRKNKDLLRLSRRRDVGRLLLYLAWNVLWIGSGVLYNVRRAATPDLVLTPPRFLLLIVASLTVGAFLTRLSRLLTSRTLTGVVVRVSFSHTYTRGEDPQTKHARSNRYDYRTKTVLTLETARKKKHRLSFEQKNGFYVYYTEGAPLVRFRGLPYPLRTDQSEETGFLCVACGGITPTKETHCPLCGHTKIQ